MVTYRFELAEGVTGASVGMSDKELRRRASLSAPFTHQLANRRYEQLMFFVEDGTVLAVFDCAGKMRSAAKEVTSPVMETIVCDDCGNDGGFCMTCSSTGHVLATRRQSAKVDTGTPAKRSAERRRIPAY